ncbi:MAG: type I DNA topoisomerase, partial [Clostridia bacterium]
MKRLIIVESPSKAKTIQKYLGADYAVLASGGHVCDLPQRTLGIDVDNRFQPQYEVNADKKDVIKRLKTAVKQNDEVYLATDPDREGEAISWHLKNCLDIPDGKNRIVFNEISKKAVNEAMQNPRELDMRLVDSQQARRVLDRLVGYKISPIISKKIKSGLSAGRVQSTALEMIVDREREITGFKPEEYWNVSAFLSKESNPAKKSIFKAAFTDVNDKKFKIKNQADAEKIVNTSKGASYVVDTAKRAVSKSHPAPPFTTSTLQQDASQKLSMTAPQTMQIAQQLYEGVDIEGEGATALVSYIRTDSVRVSPDMQIVTLKYIENKFGKDFTPKKPNIYKTKSNAQDAHEAIRPISLERTPDSLQNKINRNQYRLYKMIYERYLASQMTDAIYNTLTVHITAKNPEFKDVVLGYRVNGK